MSSYAFSIPALPIKLLLLYPFPAFDSNSSALIACTYPINWDASLPKVYTLELSVVIFTPGIVSTCSFIWDSVVATFFIGTKVSSLTYDIFNLLFIESTDTPKIVDNFCISSSLLALILPGTSPIDEIFPLPANKTLFLSYIFPRSASNVFTLILSLSPNSGKIILFDQFSLYSLSSFTSVTVFVKLTSPAEVFIFCVYVIFSPSSAFSTFVISVDKFVISIPLYIESFLFTSVSFAVLSLLDELIRSYASSYFCSPIFEK